MLGLTRRHSRQLKMEVISVKKTLRWISYVTLFASVLVWFVLPGSYALPLFFFLLIVGGAINEESMDEKQQAEVLSRRKEMDRHGASY